MIGIHKRLVQMGTQAANIAASFFKSYKVESELQIGEYECYTIFIETPCEIDGQPATKVQIIELYYVKYDTSVKYSGEYAGVSGTIYR